MRERIVHVNFDTVISEPKPERIHKYNFLEPYMSDYIEDLCTEINYDPDLSVAYLLTENPDINWNAIHKNENGTLDLGGFQLNDKYIWTVFIPTYWDLDIDFDPFNPKHNAFIAIHHMKHLQDTLKVQSDAIAAYNCGTYAVMNNQIPESTKLYVQRVMNYYNLLKGNTNE